MLTNNDILKIAVQQSAYDMSCRPEDFLSGENVVTISQKHPLARKYLPLPMKCDLVSYGSNIVAQASPEIAPLVREYIDRYPVEHCFETPNLHVLDELVRPFGQKICFMAEYFLPDVIYFLASLPGSSGFVTSNVSAKIRMKASVGMCLFAKICSMPLGVTL